MVSLVSLFLGGVYETVITALRTAHAADQREDVRQQLAGALDRLTREARMARHVDQGDDDRFQFDADFDGDGDSSGSERNINYVVQSGTLTREASGVDEQTLIRNLASLDFNYLKAGSTTEYATCDSTSSCSSAAVCCRADARVVLVTATVTRGTETISATTAAQLGNM